MPPKTVVEKLRACLESRQSIHQLLNERTIKQRQVAVTISTQSKPELHRKFIEQENLLEENMKTVESDQGKLTTLQKTINTKSPKPDWRA